MKQVSTTASRLPLIGIPRGMPYHRFGDLWKAFFKALDIQYVESEPTTLRTLEEGSAVALDETCLAMKLYLGHVMNLAGKCEFILVPGIKSFGRNREYCPHFEGLYDLVRNSCRDSRQKLITYQVDEPNGMSEADAFLELGKALGFGGREVKKAYQTAKREEQQRWQKRVLLENAKVRESGLKVFLAGHSYVLEDPYVGKPIRDFLESNGVTVLSGPVTDREQAMKNSGVLSPGCKWEINRELLGNLALKKKNIDGLILISTFPCGSDSMVNELLTRQIDSMPVLNLVLDSQSGMAGIETRLESFVDIIRFKRGLM